MRIGRIKIDNITRDETLSKIDHFLTGNNQYHIALLYSEFITQAYRDNYFKDIINNADLSLCDGQGLFLVLKIIKQPIKEQIAGVDLVDVICDNYSDIFLFGGEKKVVQKVVNKYSDHIIGFADGYNDRSFVIDKINKVKPKIIFVALGMPAQEKWIAENLEKMPSVRLAIGVGGAFDFIAARARRAPRFMQKAGLEWLWRFGRQPWRIGRIYNAVIVFPWLVFSKKVKVSTSRSDLKVRPRRSDL